MGNSEALTHSCPKCRHVITPKGKALTVSLSCTSCGTYFYVFDKSYEEFLNKYGPAIPLGSRGKIKGVLYEVMGFTVKRERKYRYIWHEYFLFNPHHGIAFLSEHDGNWNFLRPYAKHPFLHTLVDKPEIAEGKFSLYAKYRAEVLYATGEFFTDIIKSTESSTHHEHINPPYILNFEEGDKQLGAYLGEYVTPKEVASAFDLPIQKLPPKKSFGYTEPHSFSVNESVLLNITIVTLALAFLLQLVLNETAQNKKVLEAHFRQENLKGQKMFTTPSFEITGEVKNMEVKIRAPIDNDWFFAEYALINEKNNEEYVFTKEIEYYHGVEGGESWTEGNNESEAFLSSIPAGRYHINIYPEFSTKSHEFHITVYRDVPFYSNFWILFFTLCLFPAGFYGYKYYLETKRWADSDYSPYHE